MKKSEVVKRINHNIYSVPRFLGAVLSTIIIMNSCSTTNHVRDWSSSDVFDRKFNKILIMGLVNKTSLRFDLEREGVIAARKVNLTSIKGMSMFPPELGKPFEDLERVKDRLQEREFDAILTMAIIDVTAERYIAPERKYVPLVYYNQFGNYYYRTYSVVYKKGYFSLESKYFLETNLYELKTGTLVWSGRSVTFNPHDFERFVPKYAKNLFKELQNGGIIKN